MTRSNVADMVGDSMAPGSRRMIRMMTKSSVADMAGGRVMGVGVMVVATIIRLTTGECHEVCTSL